MFLCIIVFGLIMFGTTLFMLIDCTSTTMTKYGILGAIVMATEILSFAVVPTGFIVGLMMRHYIKYRGWGWTSRNGSNSFTNKKITK